MSASEVTDFERSFRYFAIWLHGQVFSKLLLGLFFQCQKSDWTYLKQKNSSDSEGAHQGKNKAKVWGMPEPVCACACWCSHARISGDLSKGKESRLRPDYDCTLSTLNALPSPAALESSVLSCWLSIFPSHLEAPSVNAPGNKTCLKPWLG